MRVDCRAALRVGACVGVIALASGAAAHVALRSYSSIVVIGADIAVVIDLDVNDLDNLLRARLDTDHSGRVEQSEVSATTRMLAQIILTGFRLSSASGPCDGEIRRHEARASETLRAELAYHCPTHDGLRVDMPLLHRLRSGHQHFLTVQHGTRAITATLTAAAPSWTMQQTTAAAATRFGRAGLAHVLVGYDHLLFLLALVLFTTAVRELLKIVTAFTLAHALTLTASALGAIAIPARVVEPAIALSVAYVGAENLWLREGRYRWLIAMALGLVHGLGFAGALAEIGVPVQQRFVPLVAFNAGIEVGQVLMVCATAFALRLLARFAWRRRLLQIGSVLIAVFGLVLFALRLTSDAA